LLDDFNDSEDCAYTEPDQPIGNHYGVVNIRSIYEVEGVDMMASQGGIAALRDPALFPLNERSERFIRVLSSDKELLGYAAVQPDGSALFKVPANTDFTLEVVNSRLKALASKNEHYAYLNALSAHTLNVAAGETLHYQQDSEVNPGGHAGYAFANTNSAIVASEDGQTMAEALADHQHSLPVVSTDIRYQDVWSLSNAAADISYSYSQLDTPAPASSACINSWDKDCSARITYTDHVQPLWEKSGRDNSGRSCVACHDNSGATGLDLTWDGVALDKANIVSYRELFSPRATYMYLANQFSPVSSNHCRRQQELPFVEQPGNDCFTCYSRVLMSDLGALESANFFELFSTEPDHSNYLFNPDENTPRINHSAMLSAEELRLISEWLDSGARVH